MAAGSGAQGAALTAGRWALASLFVVLGGWRVWGAINGAPLSNTALLLSLGELVLGVLLVAGWRVRWVALVSAALLVAHLRPSLAPGHDPGSPPVPTHRSGCYPRTSIVAQTRPRFFGCRHNGSSSAVQG